MKYIELIQRLQFNPDEAVVVYHDGNEGAAWIVGFDGILRHQHNVDRAMGKAMKAKSVRPVAMLRPARLMLFRPASDFAEATSA